MRVTAIIHPEDDRFWGEIPALEGCASEGDTVEQTALNLKEAATGWLEANNESAENERPEGSSVIAIDL